MDKNCYLLVNTKVLPSVYKGVIKAKKLLSSGEASNASQAVKMANISRSAFYKYKDCVFEYEDDNKNTINFSALLADKAGVFSAMTAVLYNYGANIITVNQGTPVDNVARVSLTVRTDDLNISVDELISKLKDVDGIISIKAV